MVWTHLRTTCFSISSGAGWWWLPSGKGLLSGGTRSWWQSLRPKRQLQLTSSSKKSTVSFCDLWRARIVPFHWASKRIARCTPAWEYGECAGRRGRGRRHNTKTICNWTGCLTDKATSDAQELSEWPDTRVGPGTSQTEMKVKYLPF